MNNERLMKVLLSPLVSEKSANAADANRQFTFQVATDATKREIAKAVEKMFDVEVERVQVVNVKGKAKRFGAMQGRRSDWKKAYVKLKPGSDIDFAGGA
ncbi:MAG: 50S ribosomal protein L23 [gamma proteobacterium endosymbiont of Lamellibrachia anaximandri]|uniref:Large ribosomal subunit protein uL23 n=1 Tax=endosymbiont of Escarpia spicata TaxID=2200908 RepID=A0A370DL40_9GAMM|nr:50S ribosomal protein L23 [gamma proteobacterium endosymbiont of Lamellibrachia anaximandri]RDH85563.1 MAG: 50S ribosomal protein L23 [endosymbiont of Escarpia spicata]MBL3534458.1 50S ribosomal protein L23 [gamma proteobacterium endosymbiont of Lamellibrachia anaximandri]MBL3589950.1 50S ribosomal protein L23 [gamma proteobacterium endosymbiont of Lamellibrachia anaximandri]MBL3601251.1 50S ribosomal protein L23 [gamma proteobacterium endosymbiont of Lamellibrachia anaximandri]